MADIMDKFHTNIKPAHSQKKKKQIYVSNSCAEAECLKREKQTTPSDLEQQQQQQKNRRDEKFRLLTDRMSSSYN